MIRKTESWKQKEKEIKELLRRVYSEARARHWLNEPHPAFSDANPQSLINASEGLAQRVLDYIQSALEGDFS